MRAYLSVLGACALSGAALGNPASAATITFSDLPSGGCNWLGNNTVQSGGYRFTGNPSDGNMWLCNANTVAQNTSPALLNANNRSIITMTAVGGAAFDLQSFDAGSRAQYMNVTHYYPGLTATGLFIEGFSNGALVGSANIAFNGLLFQTFTLGDAFNNLSSVRFTAVGSDQNAEFLIDNISVGPAVIAAIPEPSTWAMLILGIGAVGGAMRRRLAAPTASRLRLIYN